MITLNSRTDQVWRIKKYVVVSVVSSTVCLLDHHENSRGTCGGVHVRTPRSHHNSQIFRTHSENQTVY